ncbi:MAG: hypothetical protein ACR2QM_14835 [Longimicrobiales bacterium]
MLSLLATASALALMPTVVHPTVQFLERPFDLSSPTVHPWSPYGYTFSLALFALPMLVLIDWLLKHPELTNARRAVKIVMAIVLPTWVLLDVFLGLTFFEFPVPAATLAQTACGGPFHFPGLELISGEAHSVFGSEFGGRSHEGFGWRWCIPVEEIGFYVTGIATILLSYVWASEAWLKQYTACDHCRAMSGDSGINWKAIWIAAALFAGAYAYKKLLAPAEFRDGFPGYFLFLLLSSLLPAMLCYHVVKRFVNWRAMTVSLLGLLLVSLLWEVTLALPQGWWSYEPTQMMGIMIKAWHGLPIEEPILWGAAAFINVMGYEFVRWLIAKKHRLRDLRLRHVAEGLPTPTLEATASE